MVLANNLINGTTIFQDYNQKSVEYYHLELEAHSSVVANGILAETFLDCSNSRNVFKKNTPIISTTSIKDTLLVV